MRGVFWSLRRTAMVGVAIGSVAGAAAMVWMMQVGQLGTAQLLVILALFVLPGATFAAWWLDRRHKRESVVEENGLFEMPEGVEVVEEEPGESVVSEDSRGAAREVENREGRDERRVHQPHRRRRTGRMSRRE
jgi:hypothetical protein